MKRQRTYRCATDHVAKCLLALFACVGWLGLHPLAHGAETDPPVVEFFGHTAIRYTPTGSTLMFAGDARETVFVANRDCRDLEVSEGGQPVQAQRVGVQGGCQLRDIQGTQQLHTTLVVRDVPSNRTLWQMPVDRSNPRLLDWFRRVWGNRTQAPLEQTVEQLRHLLPQAADVESRIDILYALSYIDMRLGNRDMAVRGFANVAKLATDAGYRSIAFDALYRRVDLLVDAGMHDEAAQGLSQMAALATPGDSRSVTHIEYERTIIARDQGRHEEALRRFGRIIAAMDRVHDLIFLRVAVPLMALLVNKMNRVDEALSLVPQIEDLAQGAHDCARANLFNNAAALAYNIAQQKTKEQFIGTYQVGRLTVRQMFDRAVAARALCKDDPGLADLLSTEALLALLERRYRDAREYLAKAESLGGLLVDRQLQNQLVKARIEQESGNLAAARDEYDQLARLSLAHPDTTPERYRCFAALGLLECLKNGDRLPAAVRAEVLTCAAQQPKGMTQSEYDSLRRRIQKRGVQPSP